MQDHAKISCAQCGAEEFITPPNAYDCYQVVNGELCWQKSELIDAKFQLHCRECGARMHTTANQFAHD